MHAHPIETWAAPRICPCVLRWSPREVRCAGHWHKPTCACSQGGGAQDVIQPIRHARPADDKLRPRNRLAAGDSKHGTTVCWNGSRQVFLPIAQTVAV